MWIVPAALLVCLQLACDLETPAKKNRSELDEAVAECIRGPVGTHVKAAISAIRWDTTLPASSRNLARHRPSIRLDIRDEFLICRWLVILGDEPFLTTSEPPEADARAVFDFYDSAGNTKTFVVTSHVVYSGDTSTTRTLDPHLRRLIQRLTFDNYEEDELDAWSKP